MEQTRLLSRFTKELVLCYDNDNAGKIATERALEILNNSEFSVKVLQLPRRRTEDGELVKQDADDFIKLQGKDAFEALLTGSENGIEFRMAQAAGKYDLSSDEARVAYCEGGQRPAGRTCQSGRAGDLHHPGRRDRQDHAGGHEAGGPAGLQTPPLPGEAAGAAAGPEPGGPAPAQGAGAAIRQHPLRPGGGRASCGC